MIAPVAPRLAPKKPLPHAATDFFTPEASGWRMIIGPARVSTTEQNVELQQDDLRLAFEASVDPTEAR
jgi:hypothetical protein